MFVIELVLDVSESDRGLADASLAEQNHLEVVWPGADDRTGHNPRGGTTDNNLVLEGIRRGAPVLIRGIRNVRVIRGQGYIKLRLLHLSRCGGRRVRGIVHVSLRPDTSQRRGDDDDDRASVSAASTSRNQLFCSEPLRATIGAFFVAFVI